MVLYQFGVMGSVMAEEVDGIDNPRVALLNMGEEDIKGSDHIKMAASQLSENESINYVGFIEGNDIFTNKADVIVCDGFVGNVALKTCEGVARLVYEKLKHELSKHFFARFIGKILSSSLKKLFKPLNPDQYNGASLIGLRGIVIKSHGNASVLAFKSAIFEAMKEVERQVPIKIKNKLELGLKEKQ
jgi:glycerol-3-phosphate acyltransferase PlsX